MWHLFVKKTAEEFSKSKNIALSSTQQIVFSATKKKKKKKRARQACPGSEYTVDPLDVHI